MSSAELVRRARPEDVRDIAALDRTIPAAPHWPEAAYRKYMEAASAELLRRALWVAVSAEVIHGFAAASVVGDQAELESIAVEAQRRRSGLGARLLSVVEAWAHRCGADALLLEVRSANKEALGFYCARGFSQTGLRTRYYRDPVDDAVLMRLDLTGRQRPEQSGDFDEL